MDVGTSGTYDLEFRVAANASGGTFRLEVNVTDKTGTLTIPNTGGWQNWTTMRKTGVSRTRCACRSGRMARRSTKSS